MQHLLSFKYSKAFFLFLFVLCVLFFRSKVLTKPETRLTYTVTKKSLVDTVEVSSVYSTAMEKSIYSTTDGIITDLYVRNGDLVKKGDKLFHVESTATDEERATAQAVYLKSLKAYNEATQNKTDLQATLEKARQKVLDAQAVVDDKGHDIRLGDDNPDTGRKYTQEEIDSKDSALISARYNFTAVEQDYLKADQAIGAAATDLKSKKLAYDATKSIDFFAPADGQVMNLLKKTNDGVTSDTTDSPVLVIANLTNPSLIVPINELYISRVKEGQEAAVTFDAYKERTFTGVVESIATIGKDDGVVSYDARISLLDIGPDIKPNMTAIVTIETLRKDNILTVPISSVGFDGDKAYVLRVANHHAKEEQVDIKLGIRGITEFEVISGVAAGDIILANISSGK